MKAILYAVKQEENWLWRCSLDIGVDLAYWYRKAGGPVPLVWLEPEISLGQALFLLTELRSSEGIRDCPERVVKALAEKWKAFFKEVAAPLWICVSVDWQRYPGAGKEAGQAGNAAMELIAQRLAGRALLPEELQALFDLANVDNRSAYRKAILQRAYLEGRISLSQGVECRVKKYFWKRTLEYRCKRCGSSEDSLRFTDCTVCGGPCPYCEECLGMGRARFCTLLVEGRRTDVDADMGSKAGDSAGCTNLEKWNLSPAQREASLAGLKFMRELSAVPDRQLDGGGDRLSGEESDWGKNAPCFLIWAVTGAGKTEMIFPFIEEQLTRGGKVLIATPRRDVVLELAPRIRKAFSERSVVALYGGSEQRWEQGEITLATTHQLLRFSQAFDLVVIDELDAFPFHNSPMLEFAARKSVKPGGRCILLSATPPTRLQTLARAGKLPYVRVPVRYHRHPLPVPAIMRITDVSRVTISRKLPDKLTRAMESSLDRGAQIFVFVSRIGHVEPLVHLLSGRFAGKRVAGTSSADEERALKVTGFRQKDIDILVTTTILERGVTVPKTDVFILNADSGLFDEAALIQMAGRAGRSIDDPGGKVYFAAKEVTKAQAGAIRQIRRMNRLAGKKGYLLEAKGGRDA